MVKYSQVQRVIFGALVGHYSDYHISICRLESGRKSIAKNKEVLKWVKNWVKCLSTAESGCYICYIVSKICSVMQYV